MVRLTGWYPIYLKEMLIFKRKLFKLGYLFSAMVIPVMYLVAFGLGLGKSVQTGHGTYLDFLIPGLVAMSSMTNSYAWLAGAIAINRLYFKSFQVLVQAPISPSSIMIGEVLAGMTKGVFASILILLVGFGISAHFRVTPLFIGTLLLNCFLFACMGIVTGMVAKSHEDTSTYSNFFILPMAFFSGTFFPVDRAPVVIKWIIYIMPLTHTNVLIRASRFDSSVMVSLAVLLVYSMALFAYGSRQIRRYSE